MKNSTAFLIALISPLFLAAQTHYLSPTVSIPTNGLPNGVYFLSFMTATGVVTEKFVKQ